MTRKWLGLLKRYSAAMSHVVVYVNGGRSELAAKYAAAGAIERLSSPAGEDVP